MFREECVQLDHLPHHHEAEQGKGAADKGRFAFDLINFVKNQISLGKRRVTMEHTRELTMLSCLQSLSIYVPLKFYPASKVRTQLIGDHDFGVNCNMHRFNFRDFESMSKNRNILKV